MRKLIYDLIATFQHLKGTYRKDRKGFFTTTCRALGIQEEGEWIQIESRFR